MAAIAISLISLLIHAIVLSAALTGLNMRGVRFGFATAAVLAICAGGWLIPRVVGGASGLSWQEAQIWVGTIVLPSFAVLIGSRAGVFQSRPLLLLLVGPLLFLVATVVVMMLVNVIYGSGSGEVACSTLYQQTAYRG